MNTTDTRDVAILVVCTANICRSVMMHTALLAEAAKRHLPVAVSSSGFLTNGDRASEAASAVLAELGHDVGDHRSRITTPKIVRAADLVVTMERRHGRDIAPMTNDRGKVFTLVTAIDLLRAVDTDIVDPRMRIAAASKARSADDLVGTGPDEIDDPFGESLDVNRATALRLAGLSGELLEALFP
ncbi:MAG: hypothetical protein ACPHIC_03525 [Acidimicrobiales bacterium]